MNTPQDLIKKYQDNICFKCTQEGDCNIRVVRTNTILTAKCTDYKQLEQCMQHKCDTCKDNLKCFGSDNYEQY